MRFSSRFKDKTPEDGRSSEIIAQGVAIGMCFGVTAGVLIDNIGLGISLGICLGAAVGSAISENRKRKMSEGSQDEELFRDNSP